ncbi:MAG TPA: YceI family protein [Candidatus Elarobacter sp.]|nr:YceI family protein [Candidatus Elarobacter sp.]
MIQRRFACAGALAIVAALAAPPARSQVATLLPPGAVKLPFQRLAIDTDHSAVEFRIGFMGMSSVHGSFGTWEGTMMYDPAHFERTTVTIAIAADSINTSVPARDRDLRSDHFFDVKKFPYITFASTGIASHGKDYTVTGSLTMHGVTKTVALELAPVHPLAKDAWQNQRMGFTGKLTLNRKDYGIEGIAFWNNEFDPGRHAVADQVDIDVTVEAEVVNMDTRDFPKVQALIKRIDADGLPAALAAVRSGAPDAHADAFAAYRAMLANTGSKLRQSGRFADAAGVYRTLTELDPRDAEALAGLGEAELFAGDKRRAVTDFKRSVAADPTNTAALEYLRHLGT